MQVIPRITLDEAKGLFFDRASVIREMDERTKAFLSRFGNRVRADAKRSMRKANKDGDPSPPGKPPRVRSGQLKKFIFYTYEKGPPQSVLIGPIYLERSETNPTIPELHEYGGTVVRTTRQWKTVTENGRRVRRLVRTVKPVTYPPRPYMQPAFDRITKKIPEIWSEIDSGRWK